MSVTVLYFASLRDAAGVASETLPLPDSLPALYESLREKHGFSLPAPINAPADDQLERLLNAGDALYENAIKPGVDFGRKLDHPPDDSALGYYRQALALDPDNARAGAGAQGGHHGGFFCQPLVKGRWGHGAFLVLHMQSL